MISHELCEANYYTPEANQKYMSVSQYKDFCGSFGQRACEAEAMAKIAGTWEEKPNKAMLIGSYVDHHFEGTLDAFQAEHPEIFRRDGSLYSDYAKAEKLIARAEADPLFMKYMSGQKQVIMVAEIFGTMWKIKMDSYIPDTAIVDLKCMASLTDQKWVRDVGYLDFVRYWGYDIQGAIYQEAVYQNTGKRLPFFIAGISKEEEPNIEIIHVTDNYLREALGIVEMNMPHVLEVKNGLLEPMRCGFCNYCRHTKVLTAPIGLADLVVGF